MQADLPNIMTPSSWGNVDLISEIFKTTPSDGSGPTGSSVILYCPKSRNGTNHSETFSVVRIDERRGLVSAVTEGLDESMKSAYTKLKHERSWYDTVQSEDIAKQIDLELNSIFRTSLNQYPYSCFGNSTIRVQRVSNDDYDSLMKIKRSLYPKGRKGVLVIPRKSNSAINKEITDGGRLKELGITNTKYMKNEEDREIALKGLSEYVNSTEQSIKGWPLRAIYPLDERLGKKSRAYEDYGYVFLDESEIKTFRSIMDELASIPGRPIKSPDTQVTEFTGSSDAEPDPVNSGRSADEDMVITNGDEDGRYHYETPFIPHNARVGDLTDALDSYSAQISQSAGSHR